MEAVEPRVLLSTAYVDVNASGATHDGTSWTSAYLDLQSALTVAVSGDEIRVADGTYKPTLRTTAADPRSATFQLENGVALIGGYAGDGAIDPDQRNISANPTILSGDIGVVDDGSDNAYRVLVGSGTDQTAVIDGFTITSGYVPTETIQVFVGQEELYLRRGMYIDHGSPTVANCLFTGNSDGYSYGGGGMLNIASSPTVINCTFSRNFGLGGGGMGNDDLCGPRSPTASFSETSQASVAGSPTVILHPL